MPISTRFADIVAAVRAKFSEALGDGAVALKYRDFEGDFVTVTSRADLRSAMSTAVSALEREAKRTGKPSGVAPGGLAPVELEVVRVASAPSETPGAVTPENVGRADAAPGDDDDRGEDVIEIDEWLLTFATLFREHLGEAGATEGPLDLRAVGLEKCCEALEEAVGTEKAKALLASAAEKFQEAAAAIFNWGNVHVCASRKLVDTSEPSSAEGAAESQSAPSEAALAAAASTHMARIDDEYAKAVERYTQSLAIKSDFYEASIAWGQQAFERGKVLHVASKSGDDAEAKGKLAADADAMFALAEGKFQESLEDDPQGGGGGVHLGRRRRAGGGGSVAQVADPRPVGERALRAVAGEAPPRREGLAGGLRRGGGQVPGRGCVRAGHRARAYEPHLGEVGGGEGRRGGGWEEVSDGT